MILPSEDDYRTPSPPPQRELGPPPPGHGRFVDYGRGSGRGVDGGLPIRRNLDDVLCFKVECVFTVTYHILMVKIVWPERALCKRLQEQECSRESGLRIRSSKLRLINLISWRSCYSNPVDLKPHGRLRRRIICAWSIASIISLR
jgi:hypothetical protein